MTTKEIMNLDYRKEENQEIIQKVLRKIKPLSKHSDEYDIPLSDIEKVITVMCKKYSIRIKDIVPNIWANNDSIIWKTTLTNEITFETIDEIYGICLYEVFAKTAIRLYAEIKKEIKART